MFAIPSITSYSFTEGKRYKIFDISSNKALGWVRCDRDHLRAISLDGKKSAHLWYAGDVYPKPRNVYDEDHIRWELAGHFTFEDE